MMRGFVRLAADRAGAAAAEMAMVLPFLVALLFGAFELGYYFMSEHVVHKGVRDAARYAARLPMSSYPSCFPDAATEQKIQRVARTGLPDGTTSRLAGWTADTMTAVTMTCDTSGTYTGIYDEFPQGVPVITVSASVPYPSLFGLMGIPVPALTLNARNQTAAFGA